MNKLTSYTVLLLFCVFACNGLHAQNPVDGYSVFQQVVSQEGGGIFKAEEGVDGDYYVEYGTLYNDTLLINTLDNSLPFSDELDTVPRYLGKIIKYNKDNVVVAEQIFYHLQPSLGEVSHILERMRYDSGDLYIQFEAYILSTKQKSFFVGDTKIVLDSTSFDVGVSGQIVVVLDGETLEYKSHVIVQSEASDKGYERWNVKHGFLYFWRTVVNTFVVGNDTIPIEQDPYSWKKSVHLAKYDYRTDEVLWSTVIAADLPWSSTASFPLYMGLDIDDDGTSFISLGTMPFVYVLSGDTIQPGEYSSGHSASVVVNTDGEIIRTDVIDGYCLLVDVKTIGDDAYLLVQSNSTNEIYYRGEEVPRTSFTFVIKIDATGAYQGVFNTSAGCSARYNYMRVNDKEELVLFGQISNWGDDCNGLSFDGQDLMIDDNSSILTVDGDLNFVSHSVFTGRTVQTIPSDENISSSAKFVRYKTSIPVTTQQIFAEVPFYHQSISHYARRTVLLGRPDAMTSSMDIQYQKPIVVYPNPASEAINIIKDSGLSNKVSIQILTIDGKSIMTIPDYDFESIDLSGLANGAYILQYTNDNQVRTEKIIKI